MSKYSFKEYWNFRKTLHSPGVWDAKNEELRHLSTWLHALSDDRAELEQVKAELNQAVYMQDKIRAEAERDKVKAAMNKFAFVHGLIFRAAMDAEQGIGKFSDYLTEIYTALDAEVPKHKCNHEPKTCKCEWTTHESPEYKNHQGVRCTNPL